MAVSATAHGVHFYLLDKETAWILCLVAGIRSLVSIYSTDKRLTYLFLTIVLVNGYYTYEGTLTILATLGSTLSTIGTFRETDKALRLFKMPATSCWIAHNFMVPTPMGVIIEVFYLASNFLGYYRFYGRPSLDKAAAEPI